MNSIPSTAVATAIGAVLLLSGCASGGGGFTGTPDLTGTRWVVTSIDGRAPVRGETLTADFGVDGRINGNSGCNSFSGPYLQNGSSVQIGELLSTRRACTDSTRQRQETRMLALLEGTSTVKARRDQITLSTRGGSIVLEPGDVVIGGSSSVSGAVAFERVSFNCDGVPLTVEFHRDSAAISWPDGRDVLPQQRAASGIWYESRNNSLRGKQNLTWVQDGRRERTCRPLR